MQFTIAIIISCCGYLAFAYPAKQMELQPGTALSTVEKTDQNPTISPEKRLKLSQIAPVLTTGTYSSADFEEAEGNSTIEPKRKREIVIGPVDNIGQPEESEVMQSNIEESFGSKIGFRPAHPRYHKKYPWNYH